MSIQEPPDDAACEGIPIWDTPLHDIIELTDCTLTNGDLVIMHPDTDRKPNEWLQSPVHFDTYEVR